MNNNPNENLNQMQGGISNNSFKQPNTSDEQTTISQPQIVTSTTVGDLQSVTPQPVNASTQAVNESVENKASNTISEQRVNLVEKPVIQAVVPNKEVRVETVVDEPKEEKIEVLEEVKNSTDSSVVSETKYGGKIFFLIILFGGLFAMIFFLPEISNYIETQKYLETHVEEKITTGTLKCEYEDSTETLDYTYSLDFAFTDSKLTKLTYLLEIRGDANLDEEELGKYKSECDQISLNVEKLNGITISCSLANGLYKQKQTLSYSSINVDDAMTAYTEAGGIYPDYENGESIDDIEKNMNASGYTCERIS